MGGVRLKDRVKKAVLRRQDPGAYATGELKAAARAVLKHQRGAGLPARFADDGALIVEFDAKRAERVRYAHLSAPGDADHIRCERRLRDAEGDRKDPRRPDTAYFTTADAVLDWYVEAFAEARAAAY